MANDNKTIYRSKIDWWVWCVLTLALAVIWTASVDMIWWAALIYGGGLTLLFVGLLFGCWYEIDDGQLVVYQFFRPNRFPISKIKEVGKTVGYLATAGMSRERVTIKFVDRSVMKSVMPLEISPKDRNGFIAQLQQINPEITVATKTTSKAH